MATQIAFSESMAVGEPIITYSADNKVFAGSDGKYYESLQTYMGHMYVWRKDSPEEVRPGPLTGKQILYATHEERQELLGDINVSQREVRRLMPSALY